MLYRQKHVAVWGLSPEAPEEAEFLHSIGCQVTYIAPKRPQALAPGIEFLPGAVTAVHGGAAVTSVEVKGEALAVDFPAELLSRVPEDKRDALTGVLAQDPRPHYQSDPQRVYGMAFAGLEVRFRVADGAVYVVEVTEERDG